MGLTDLCLIPLSRDGHELLKLVTKLTETFMFTNLTFTPTSLI